MKNESMFQVVESKRALLFFKNHFRLNVKFLMFPVEVLKLKVPENLFIKNLQSSILRSILPFEWPSKEQKKDRS